MGIEAASTGLVLRRAQVERCEDVRVPGWVGDVLGAEVIEPAGFIEQTSSNLPLHFARHSLLSVNISGAFRMSDEALEGAVYEGYRWFAAELGRVGREPVRFWNHVPEIGAEASGGRDRYMVFNAGRYRAFLEWFGSAAAFETRVVTASGVGTRGPDLVMHCLGMDEAGVAVNNPRQVLPFHYSQRFGPVPPCFARATLVRSSGTLLVGGTASVRGEDSFFRHDLGRQLRETFLNMGAIVASALGREWGKSSELMRLLSAYTDLRVYVPRAEDEGEIVAGMSAAFPNVKRVEVVPADLCRAELLVEIEGVANVG